MDSNYDDLAKKAITLENRINEHSKFMLEIAKRQDALRDKLQE